MGTRTASIVVLGALAQHPDDERRVRHRVAVVGYKGLSSLSEYVLVSHRERRIEVWARDREATWTCTTARSGEVAQLASIGARLEVDELYEAATEPAG